MGVRFSFSWDTFGIKRMIGDKIIHSGFLGYNIDIDLPFMAQNFNLWVGGFFCFFFLKKKNNEDTTMSLRGGNMHVLRGLFILFFYWNSSNTKLPLNFNKNKVICGGAFVIFIWFYCKYHVGLSAWVWHDFFLNFM